jgi:hypothetical protein
VERHEDLARLLDLRLAGLWTELFEVPREQWDPELIGWYLRTAYSQGYADAMSYIDRAEMRDELQRIDGQRPEAA